MRHRKQPNVALSQYASLILLRMFNPAMQCVRGLSDASALKKVQRLIDGRRVSLGSLSGSVRVFDPQLLEPMIEGLLADLPQQQAGAGQRRNIPETVPEELAAKLHAIDGSSLRALPQIANAIGAGDNRKWKLHLQFRVLKGRSTSAVITPDEPGGEDDGRSVLATHLDPNLVDVPAEVIAAMYSLRWSIEFFFRWLKHLLGCRHLISEKPQGRGDSDLLCSDCVPSAGSNHLRQRGPPSPQSCLHVLTAYVPHISKTLSANMFRRDIAFFCRAAACYQRR